MMQKLKNLIFRDKKIEGLEKYSGVSDFFLHASDDEKKRVMNEAARKANEDQLKVFRAAKLKAQSN